jgi:hypothetical protein
MAPRGSRPKRLFLAFLDATSDSDQNTGLASAEVRIDYEKLGRWATAAMIVTGAGFALLFCARSESKWPELVDWNELPWVWGLGCVVSYLVHRYAGRMDKRAAHIGTREALRLTGEAGLDVAEGIWYVATAFLLFLPLTFIIGIAGGLSGDPKFYDFAAVSLVTAFLIGPLCWAGYRFLSFGHRGEEEAETGSPAWRRERPGEWFAATWVLKFGPPPWTDDQIQELRQWVEKSNAEWEQKIRKRLEEGS